MKNGDVPLFFHRFFYVSQVEVSIIPSAQATPTPSPRTASSRSAWPPARPLLRRWRGELRRRRGAGRCRGRRDIRALAKGGMMIPWDFDMEFLWET